MVGRGIRRAARALVVDEAHRALLVRLQFPTWQGWVLPGGGIEDGEDELVAIRRELAEETGLIDAELIGPIWERTVLFSDPVAFDGQTDRIWFVRCASFDPTPALPWDALRAEGMTDLRWWTREEIAASSETFAPGRLASLLHDLIENGLPASMVDVGE
jgi:8-oxo-dGTP pyrophosphatase MutT (NUDIX family)